MPQTSSSNRLAEIRLAAGLTQQQLARRAGLGGHMQVSKIERGVVAWPSLRTACALAEALEVAIGDIWSEAVSAPSAAPSSNGEVQVGEAQERSAAPTPVAQERSAAPLLTADQVARWLNTPRRSVWEMAKRGELPCVRIHGRQIRFREEDVHGFIDRRVSWRPRGVQS